jgi:hypothetical protein
MPRQPINWDALTEVPMVSSPLLDSGYVTRVFLPPIEGQIRQVQAKCTLCGKLFTPVAAHNHNKTSNWLNHVRDKHPQEAQTLHNNTIQASTTSVSTTENQIRPFLLDNRIRLTNQKLRQDVLRFIIECNIPIRAVNSSGFQQLLSDLNAPGTINRDIIGREITTTYQNDRAKVESLLVYLAKTEGQKFSICIDC